MVQIQAWPVARLLLGLMGMFFLFNLSPSSKIWNTSRFKNGFPGLPWWSSGWESTCQCRGHGFDPWCWKIPRASEQQSSCAATAEPALQSRRPQPPSLCASAVSRTRSLQVQKACAKQQSPSASKNKQIDNEKEKNSES